ncbi:MAG: recombinase family protein [Gemmatimonadales bacterium]
MFIDQCPATSIKRPELETLLNTCSHGDELLVSSIGQISSNLKNLHDVITRLLARGTTVHFEKEALSFASGQDEDGTLALLSALAEFERELDLECRHERLEDARRQGKLGAPRKLSDVQISEVVSAYKQGTSISALARGYDATRKTINSALRSRGVK